MMTLLAIAVGLTSVIGIVIFGESNRGLASLLFFVLYTLPFFAVVGSLIYASMKSDWLTRMQSACTACGYKLHGSPSDICPECGKQNYRGHWTHQTNHGQDGEPLCINCGFDLRGTTGGVCPECGHEHKRISEHPGN